MHRGALKGEVLFKQAKFTTNDEGRGQRASPSRLAEIRLDHVLLRIRARRKLTRLAAQPDGAGSLHRRARHKYARLPAEDVARRLNLARLPTIATTYQAIAVRRA